MTMLWAPAACVTVNARPATAMTPLRAWVVGLGAAEKPSTALPAPAAASRVIQPTLAVAVQVQVSAATTATSSLQPDAGATTLCEESRESAYVQKGGIVSRRFRISCRCTARI